MIIDIDLPAAKAQRLKVALGKYLRLYDEQGLPREADISDMRQHVRQVFRTITIQQERADAEAALPAVEDF